MKQRRAITFIFLFGFFGSIVAPAATALDTLDQRIAPLPPVVMVKSTTSGSAFGGEGGGPFEVVCPTNHLVTGVYVSSGVSSLDYNYAFALRCTQVKLAADNSLTLEGTGDKKVVFEFNGIPANQPSLCSSGMGLTRLTGYHQFYEDFVADLAATCKTFNSQANSENISSAIGWDQYNYRFERVSSCEAGSFVTGVYGRNGEGIDKVGVRCGSFYVDFPKHPVFESALPADLIPTSNSSIAKSGESVTCSVGTFGYKLPGTLAKDAENVELDSVTLLLKSAGQTIGSASSDNYRNLPKWLLGLSDDVADAIYSKGSATWKLALGSSSPITCQIMAFKDHQMTYVNLGY